MKTVKRSIRFDFDIGDISKSPCRNCSNRINFPSCMDSCKTLDRFQRILADTVSCVREGSPEYYRVCWPSA